MNWCSGFEAICRADAPLGELTWYKVGGRAKWLVEPRDEAELSAVLVRIRDAGLRWRVLGRGANVLIRDEGYDGVVLRLSGDGFSRVEFDGTRVYAGAAVDFPSFVRKCCGRNLVGMEVLAGVPGSIGGAVRMNAGGRYGETGRFVRSVRIVDGDGVVSDRSAESVAFEYRHTKLDGVVVVGATFELTLGDGAAAMERHREIWKEKFRTQPSVSKRSAGCIFKNPPHDSAGRLIDAAGLKRTRVGGAEISERHANFIVAESTATATDVIRLIDVARDRVRETAGVELQLEVDVW